MQPINVEVVTSELNKFNVLVELEDENVENLESGEVQHNMTSNADDNEALLKNKEDNLVSVTMEGDDSIDGSTSLHDDNENHMFNLVQ